MGVYWKSELARAILVGWFLRIRTVTYRRRLRGGERNAAGYLLWM